MIEVIKSFLPELEKQPITLAKNKKKYDNLIGQYEEELCKQIFYYLIYI